MRLAKVVQGAGPALVFASAALAHLDHSVAGPAIFQLRATGQVVKVACDNPSEARWKWNSGVFYHRCDNGKPVSPGRQRIVGTTGEIARKPVGVLECSTVGSVWIENTGTVPIKRLRVELWNGNTLSAASIPHDLDVGRQSRIAHTGEAGVYILLKQNTNPADSRMRWTHLWSFRHPQAPHGGAT